MSLYYLASGSTTEGFFTDINRQYLSDLITQTIAQTYSGTKVVVPMDHIDRIMQKIQWELTESVAKMNRRVVLDITREFIEYTEDNERINNWNNARFSAERVLDGNLNTRNFYTPKLRQNLNYTKSNGGRFFFTY